MSALYELYDSDNPVAIPAEVKAAGYDDGYAASAWAAYGWARFPDALHISIYGNPDSDIDDVESGGDTPADAPNFAAGRRARGKVAIIYVNRSNGHLVEQYLRGAGFTQAEVVLWIATDDGTQVVTNWMDGTPVYYAVWAVQYLNEAHGSGGHYDRSLVYLAFSPGGGTIGGADLTPQETEWLAEVHGAVGRLEIAFGTVTPAGAANPGPNYLGFINNEVRAALAQIADIQTKVAALQGGAPTDLTPVMTGLTQLDQRLSALTLKAV